MFARILAVPDYPRGALKLIKPSPAHAPASLGWVQDTEVGQYMAADFSQVSLAGEQERLRQMVEGDDAYGWMIELDGEVIGAIEINRLSQTSAEHGVKAANFSTLIGDKRQWGKRIAPYAKLAVMKWGFEEAGFGLFAARVLPANERSWRSLERLGFFYEGMKSGEPAGQPVQWRTYTMDKARYEQLPPDALN